ncbi:MAG TPA: hypothetical protein VFG68_17320 [Fimbriiglobus sp.]|nr:hypothetical protein [Fimbriiglobus sp.]
MTPPATPSSSDELAAAMRNSLAARRFFRGPPPLPPVPAPPAELLPQLTATACVLGHPAPPGRGLSGRLGRLARRAVKRLMNPWLDRQSQFNAATASYLTAVHGYLAEVTDRTNALQAELDRQAVAIHSRPGAMACCGRHTGAPPDDPVRVVEGLFLDTRLPPPPARVLVLTPDGEDALDLAGRGYHVVQTTNGVGSFADESFDVAVALTGDRTFGPPADATLASLGRVLTPGGRVIGSGPSEPAARPGLLRVVERVYAVRASHGWSLVASPTDDAELTFWVAAKN